MSYNKVFLIGNVGKDPDVRHLESGTAVAQFSLATSERYRDKNGATQELTEWHNIVCWRQLAEIAEKHITKGTQIFVEGKIRTRNWTDQTGAKRYTTEIYADNVRLLGKKGDSSFGASSQGGFPAAPAAQPAPEQNYAQPFAQQPSTTVSNVNSQPIVSPADIAVEASDDLPF